VYLCPGLVCVGAAVVCQMRLVMHQKKNRRNERKLKARKERSQSKQSEMAAGKIKLKISTESKVGGGGSGSGEVDGCHQVATVDSFDKQTDSRQNHGKNVDYSQRRQPATKTAEKMHCKK